MKQTIAIYESLFDLAKKKKNPNILLLIDEGDAFLHLEWQRRYIMQINDFLYRCKKDLDIKNLQLILATHSPLLATDIPRDFVCTLDSPDPQPSFAAPLQLILNKSFNSRSIGEFATREINRTLHRIKSGKLENKDLYIIEMIDDPVIKREILYLLKEAKENAN
ncbi:AAA family ATPase [Pseudomonas sp. ADAK13]|uniref:AAA family ATPase n=1 Tax=Pseudomonas sp. ADAK13 TaxID=2730847 RepID=UPI00146313BC|nr:AAA family ATPase [Pseudomonas sp. ADAK13]QJI38414.1 ATP-binding protein [Pseudomonas sp. ADAK13]